MDTGSAEPIRGSSHSEEERAFLQGRLALFWKAVFLIALGTDVVELLVDPASFVRTGAILDRVSTLFFGLLWLLCRGERRSWGKLLAVEWIGLAVVVGVLALDGRYLAAESIAHFAAQSPGIDPGSLAVSKAADAFMSVSIILGGGLILLLRAAVVPAPPLRTLVLTALLGLPLVAVPFFFAPASAGAPALRTADFPVVGAITYSIWWAIVTVGATVISRVVFGLRAEMRRARRLGQYTIEAKIGEGGMGVVYRAHHGMMRRPTAIKLLRPEKAIAANLKRFEREVQLTARLTHPHTITIFDYGRTPEGLFYYAMELLDGASLDRVVAVAGRLEPARVIHALYEVAGALVEAHESGLIHRDIKPANIILCRQGGLYDFPKVVDFGLVKDMEPAGSAALSRADVIAGTPLYIAPEAITSPESVSPQSDLYSLGAVGYFALTGQNPFQGRTLVEVCSHHLHTRPERPSARVDEPLPADLEALVLDCLEKDPTRRPAGARELRRRLEACADFGGWTEADARAWWDANAVATAPTLSDALDGELTLTRQLSPLDGEAS
jgi:tRNA A-37 threonylcarbamoyl transferase component Bud32